MKYTKEKRLDIGKRVFNHELTYVDAAKEYDASYACIAHWVREYKQSMGIAKRAYSKGSELVLPSDELSQLRNLSKEELIDEVIKARINELRSKKGYEVKGGGAKKVFVSLKNKNTK